MILALKLRTLMLLSARMCPRMTQTMRFCSSQDLQLFREREEQRERQINKLEGLALGDGNRVATEKRARITGVRTQILEAAVSMTKEHGWSRKSIEAGVKLLGLPSILHGMFPGGGFELVEYFTNRCDERLKQHLQEGAQQQLRIANGQLKFVEYAIQYRLNMLEPHLNTWPEAVALCMLPVNTPGALKMLLHLSDEICFQAGDRSTDLNWYTRRFVVASLFKAAELHFLQDTSVGHHDTRAYLSRRIIELEMVHSSISGSGKTAEHFISVASSVGATIRNMAGIPFSR